MNTYSIPPSQGILNVIPILESGITLVGVIPFNTEHPGCAGCFLEVKDGSIIEFLPSEESLEHKFEVYPLEARIVDTPNNVEWHNIEINSPLTVTLLKTEDWLDPGIECVDTIGKNPIMQCQGPVGTAPETASAVCCYIGGLRMTGTSDNDIFISTTGLSYGIHLKDFANDKRVNESNFTPLVHYIRS